MLTATVVVREVVDKYQEEKDKAVLDYSRLWSVCTISGPYWKLTACTMITGGWRDPQSGKANDTT